MKGRYPQSQHPPDDTAVEFQVTFCKRKRGTVGNIESLTPTRQLHACERIVASAAPFTPISNQKIKIGSSTNIQQGPNQDGIHRNIGTPL